MSVTLVNKERRMKVYALPHETYCKALGSCVCTKNSGLVCSSLTLPSQAEVEDLPNAVLRVEEIQRDVREGLLGLRKPLRKSRKTKTRRKTKKS